MKRLAASHARQRPTPAARGRTTAAFVPSPNDVPLTAARTAAARTARTVRALCPAEVAGFGSASRTMTSDTGAPAEVHARAGVEAGGRLGVVVVEPLGLPVERLLEGEVLEAPLDGVAVVGPGPLHGVAQHRDEPGSGELGGDAGGSQRMEHVVGAGLARDPTAASEGSDGELRAVP